MRSTKLIAGLLLAATALPAFAQDAGPRPGRERGVWSERRAERNDARAERQAERQIERRIEQPRPEPRFEPRVIAPPVPGSVQGDYQQRRGNWRGSPSVGLPPETANPADRALARQLGNRPDWQRRDRDWDNDGIPNRRDRDRDGDGIRNGRDRDWDNDGVRNRRDADRNGDGRIDRRYDWDRDGRIDRRVDRNRDGRIDPRHGYGRPGWDRSWRNDRRYDWQRYRALNRGFYRLPRYRPPYDWRYGYQRFSIGIYLNSGLFSRDYWLDEPFAYRLPPAYPPYRWVRYYNDALLVDTRDGYVVDTIYDVFW